MFSLPRQNMRHGVPQQGISLKSLGSNCISIMKTMKNNEFMVNSDTMGHQATTVLTTTVKNYDWRAVLSQMLQNKKEYSVEEIDSMIESSSTTVVAKFCGKVELDFYLQRPQHLGWVLIALSYKIAERAASNPSLKGYGSCKTELKKWADGAQYHNDPQIRKCANWLRKYVKEYEKDVKWGESHWSPEVLKDMKESSVVGKLHKMVLPLWKELYKNTAWKGGKVAPTFEEMYAYCGTFCTSGYDNSLQKRVIRH